MPNYTYIPSIPAADHNPSTDQPDMLINATSIASIVAVDLYGFGVNNGGYHQKSTYIVQGSDPIPSNTDGAQGIVYARTSNSIAEIYLTRYGSATPVQMTRGPISAVTSGYSFLPGGILIQWGQIDFSSATKSVTFPVAFTSTPFSLTFGVDTTTPSSNGTISYGTGTLSSTGFTARQMTNGSLTGKYIAIGV